MGLKTLFPLVQAAGGATNYHGPAYESRGHGEGLRGNKYAKSSFKQNKRRGL